MNTQLIRHLNQIKNASLFKKEVVKVPYTRNLFFLVKLLYEEGFLQSFKITSCLRSDKQKDYFLLISLRYFQDKPVLQKMKVISSPSNFRYLKFFEIVKLRDTKNTLFFSTNCGVMTSLTCKQTRTGGLLLFLC